MLASNYYVKRFILACNEYNFNLSWFELIYEYQKMPGFSVLYCTHKGYQFSVSHMLGLASPIKQESEEGDTPSKPIHHLLVRKLVKNLSLKLKG